MDQPPPKPEFHLSPGLQQNWTWARVTNNKEEAGPGRRRIQQLPFKTQAPLGLVPKWATNKSGTWCMCVCWFVLFELCVRVCVVFAVFCFAWFCLVLCCCVVVCLSWIVLCCVVLLWLFVCLSVCPFVPLLLMYLCTLEGHWSASQARVLHLW